MLILCGQRILSGRLKDYLNKMFDLIAIGDTSRDVFSVVPDESAYCNIDTKECVIAFEYGAKIIVEELIMTIGGNSPNVAVGASRLGLNSALYTQIGDDEIGEVIVTELKKEKVSLSYVKVEKGKRSNYTTAISFQGERTLFVYHEPREYELPDLEKSAWVYLSSTGNGFERMHAAALDYVKRVGAKLAYNPGSHQMKAGMSVMGPVMMVSEIVFMNREETADVLGEGYDSSDDVKKLMNGVLELGVKIAVLTDGPSGSYATDGKNYWNCGIFEAKIVDRTGCGDAYSTGFTVAISKGLDIPTAMVWGTMESAGVIAAMGPQGGLLTVQEMERILMQNPDFKAKLI